MRPSIRICVFIIGILLASCRIAAYDNGHFYRATNLFYKPLFDHDGLTSFLVTVGGGSTDTARNSFGQSVPLFDIYGTSAMQPLGLGVPNKNFQNPNDVILAQLANLPSNSTFGQLSICGTFSIVESNLLFTQNMGCGFFMQAHLPVRFLKVSDTVIRDISPGTSECHPFNDHFPNVDTPIWRTFLQQFPSILNQYGLCTDPFSKTGVGDFTLSFGWTHSYQNTDVLDYIDATIQAGFLAPTAPLTDINQVFAIPLGYDGHWGVPLSFDLAIGACEWITVGAHLDAIIFFDTTHAIRMKTAAAQSGLITLTSGCAEINRGILWNGSVYFIGDHVARGWSFLLGYTYTKQNDIIINPEDCLVFDPSIVNSDPVFQGWHMHTFNLALEYDFTCNESRIGSHIGIFYNHQLGGERIFETNIVGGYYGVDIAWDF